MTSLRLWLAGRLPGLNEVTAENRGNRYAGAQQKKRTEAGLAWQLRDVGPLPGRYHWHFTWHAKDKRRNPDNIASAVKFIFDALQHAGILSNDGWAQIASIHHDDFVVSKPEGAWVYAVEADEDT